MVNEVGLTVTPRVSFSLSVTVTGEIGTASYSSAPEAVWVSVTAAS